MSTRQTTISPHHSEHGSWLLAHGEPADHLRGYVHGYEGYREDETHFERHLQSASSKIPLIINFGEPFRIDGPRDRDLEVRSFVAGLHDGPTLVGAEGPQHCVQVDLTPLSARRIFGVPMHELSNRVVELDDLLGRTAPLLIERLHDAPAWEERFAILDGFLSDRLARAPEIPAGLDFAWQRIERDGGRLSVGSLAGELGWSHKHLIAQFRAHIGLPPKRLARILRFERAMTAINGGDSICLASVAQATGYFDQAHLHRDVRQFTGLPPAELLRRRIPNMDALIGD